MSKTDTTMARYTTSRRTGSGCAEWADVPMARTLGMMRLAEYEDTGLSPKDVIKVWEESDRLMVALNAEKRRADAAVATIQAICAHCGWQAGSKECADAECLINEWHGLCAENTEGGPADEA